MLILPAITMESKPVCGMEEHSHSASCYEEIRELICDIEEDDEHTHNEDCYITKQVLTCGIQEHTHTEKCYEQEDAATTGGAIEFLHNISDFINNEDARVYKEESIESTRADAYAGYSGESIFDGYADDYRVSGSALDNISTEITVEVKDSTASGGAIEAVTNEGLSEAVVEKYTETTTAEIIKVYNALGSAVSGRMTGDVSGIKWSLSVNSSGDYTLTFSGSGEIPENVMELDSTLSEYREVIADIIISQEITAIGESALKNCTNIRTVTFTEGSRLERIGGAAFSGCTNLNSINLEACHNLTVIDNAVDDMDNGDENLLKSGGAFYNTGLTQVTIPASVTMLDSCTFYGCKSLKNVTIEEESKINTFGASVFAECSALEKINLEACQEDQVVMLDSNINYYNTGIFYKCTSLKEITIPHGFGAQGSTLKGFCRGCSSLEKLTFETNTNVTGASGQIATILDNDCVNIQVYDLTPLVNLTESGSYSIRGGMSTVILPKSLRVLNTGVISDCNVNQVIFEEGSELIRLDGETFVRSRMLTSIDLSNTKVEDICSRAFEDCSLLESVILPSTTKHIGELAFNRCSNLNSFVYNAADLEIGSETNTNCSRLFEGVASKFTLTVGKDVDRIPAKFLQQVSENTEGFIFEGNNTFEVYGDDVTGIIQPLNRTGTYYADLSGNLFRLENGEAELIYVNKEVSGDFKVPESIIDENGISYTVTGIGSYAFNNDRLTSVSFENINNISSISDYAFADCAELSSIGGKTTVEEANILFAGASVGSNIYNNTKIGEGLSEKVFDDATKDSGRSIMVGDIELSYTGEDTFYTGQTANIVAALSNSNVGDVYRIYFKGESELKYSTNFSIQGFQVGVNLTDEDGVYYYEIKQLEAGSTLSFKPEFIYPNFTAPGKKVYIWTVSGTSEDLEEYANKVIKPGQKDLGGITPSDEYFEFEWITNAKKFNVTKDLNDKLTPGFRITTDKETVLSNLSYNISLKAEEDSLGANIGSDNVRYIDFKDKLKLPEGLSWRDGIELANTRFVIKGKSAYLYITIDGREYDVCSVSLQTENITQMYLEKDDNGDIYVCWRATNTDTKSEISAIHATLTFGSEILVANNGVTIDQKFEIKNDVDTDLFYTYSAHQVGTAADTTTITAGNGDITLNKERLNKPEFMGDDVTYRITLDNTSVFPYEHLGKINDDLGEAETTQYIKAENMQAMFDGSVDDSEYMQIIIENAVLSKLTSGTVKTTDGNTTADISAQNTGVDSMYNGYYEQADTNALTSDAKLTLSYVNEVLTLKAEYNDTINEITIGEGKQQVDIKSALDSIGYIVTQDDYYRIIWDYPENYNLEGGAHKEFEYTATVKNSFMYLPADRAYFYEYPNAYANLRTQNIVTVTDKEGNKIGEKQTNDDARVNKEIELRKGASVDGEMLDNNFVLNDDTVVDYYLYIAHNGTGSYDLLPIVDHMAGAQIVLAPVSENENASWTAETCTYNGIDYYVLNSAGTYKGVWLNGIYADSVTVLENSGGLDTIIKWYIKDTKRDSYSLKICYTALANKELSGCNSDSFSISNEAWLNDHITHRLWDTIFGGGAVIGFDKNIVTNEANLPKNDVIDDDDASIITQDKNVVTYRLEFTSLGDAETVLYGKDIYDKLPETPTGFTWSKDNVSFNYKTENGVTITYGETPIAQSEGNEWTLTDSNPDPNQYGTLKEGQQYITWSDSFKITFTEHDGKAYIYVTLVFPADDEKWAAYLDEKGGSVLSNTLYTYNLPKTVTHTLSDPGKVLLQKGVYETGYYTKDGFWNSYYDYFRGADRYHYVENHSDCSEIRNVVTYYVILKNSGKTNMYLSPVYDILPKGFEYMALRCVVLEEWPDPNGAQVVGSTNLCDNNTMPTQFGGIRQKYLIAMPEGFTDYDPNFVKADVHYEGTTKTEDGRSRLKFTFTDASDTDNNLESDENGNPYLKPGQYFQFAYTCFTGDADINRAVNTTAMEYINYGGEASEVVADTTTKINISDANGKEPNDGTRKVYSDAEATAAGFTEKSELNPDHDPKWLVSDVAVTKGEVIPGITKTVENPMIQANQPINWTVKLHSNGTLPITDYTFEDTMEAPYLFEGDVKYSLISNDENFHKHWQSSWDGYEYLRAQSSDKTRLYLFTIGERTVGDSSINIMSNDGSEYTVPINGDGVWFWATLRISDMSSTNSLINVSIKRDEKGNETLTVKFVDSSWSILPNSYAKIDLSTIDRSSSKTDGQYINHARLITADKTYDASEVTQGKNQTDENGNNTGVTDKAPVNIYTSYPTGAVKEITECGNESNTAKSTDLDNNYIFLNDKNKEFTYTLTVNNAENIVMDQLVIIDNLPEVGDHSTIRSDVSRDSEFKVRLADNPSFSVTVNNVELDKSKYTIEYSDATEFDKSTDFRGVDTDKWSTEMSDGTRSIRLIIDDKAGIGEVADENRLIPKDADIKLKFNAVIDGDAAPGHIAWNSFAYDYLVDGTYLYAAPLNVGVRIPGAPRLSKTLVGSSGNPVNALKNETFGFIIYNGEPIIINDFSKESIASLLGGRDFTYVELQVENGKSTSDVLMLDPYGDLYKYEYSDGKLNRTGAKWSWESDTRYNVVETAFDGNYEYFATNGMNEQRNYTFTYEPDRNIALKFDNAGLDWKIKLTKTDDENRPLGNAVFGLYTTDKADMLSEAEFNDFKALYGLDSSVVMEITDDSGTYYLKSIAVSSDNGIIEWQDLSENSYLVKELKAPDGYNRAEENYILSRSGCDSDGINEQTIINYKGMVLPSTGGYGLWVYYGMGTLLILLAVVLYCVSKRHRA